ncbi:cytochrome P450 [Colletotrichum navitas]|uniref:Cytochrome P450 n=1 Tax=Colletotrichum navitas TaxID=681940 RepID=A0AAD8V1E7_9PEZI|nr:cytochrome P450 [Colletotrichum navitas]KAK1574244.1 cytochrome P450 [Colletotrichum navitas]
MCLPVNCYPHILYALSLNPTYQEKLYQDLAQQGFPTDMGCLENILRLKACVKEGIRWAGIAAAMLPRVVPQGGVELCGMLIPEGVGYACTYLADLFAKHLTFQTVITTSPIWYLRDKYAYPNPEFFDPYRWIYEDGLCDAKKINKTLTQSGSSFSYFELFLSLAKMVENFKLVHMGKDGFEPVAGLNSSG